MSYSKGHDVLMFPVRTHRVMHDRLQIVIQHHTTCPSKGARLDRYKTFHRTEHALELLAQCGETLTTDQHVEVVRQGTLCDQEAR